MGLWDWMGSCIRQDKLNTSQATKGSFKIFKTVRFGNFPRGQGFGGRIINTSQLTKTVMANYANKLKEGLHGFVHCGSLHIQFIAKLCLEFVFAPFYLLE